MAAIGGGTNVSVNTAKPTKRDYYSHTSVTEFVEREGKDFVVDGYIDISVGPDFTQKVKVPGVFKGDPDWNHHFNDSWHVKLYNINRGFLGGMTQNLRGGSGLLGMGDLKWSLFGYACVNHGARSLWLSGVPTLPINVHPFVLGAQLSIRNVGIHATPYMTREGR